MDKHLNCFSFPLFFCFFFGTSFSKFTSWLESCSIAGREITCLKTCFRLNSQDFPVWINSPYDLVSDTVIH